MKARVRRKVKRYKVEARLTVDATLLPSADHWVSHSEKPHEQLHLQTACSGREG